MKCIRVVGLNGHKWRITLILKRKLTMILQLEINDKYTTTDKKYNVVKEWGSIREIQTTLPSINAEQLITAIQTKNKYNNYYWVELRW